MGVEYNNRVKDGELQKWDTVGTVVEGVYINYRLMANTGKGPGNLYEIQTKEGVVPFFAPSLLHAKLKQVPKGSIVRVEYVKESKTKVGNTLKEFTVDHTEATEVNLNALGIKIYKDTAAEEEGRSQKAEEDFKNM